MKQQIPPMCLVVAVLLAAGSPSVIQAQVDSSNIPPQVSILWPAANCTSSYIFGSGTSIKIKANALDPDGSIAQVQFFADTTLIGVATNAPFCVIWTAVPSGSTPNLKAVAMDNLGATTVSASVQIIITGGFPTAPVFAINSPPNGTFFAAWRTFVFTAELLASPLGDTGPVEFFVGTNSVGIVTQSRPFTATTSPYSLTVTNVPEGDYILRVKKGGSYANSASCQPITIHVVKLAAQFPRG